MEEFLNQIKDTMFLYQLMFNQLIDKAEEFGLYPTEELHQLDETMKQLFKDYDEPGADRAAIWEQLSEISSVLKNNKGSEMADKLWNILAAIEDFIHTYYLIDDQ